MQLVELMHVRLVVKTRLQFVLVEELLELLFDAIVLLEAVLNDTSDKRLEAVLARAQECDVLIAHVPLLLIELASE